MGINLEDNNPLLIIGYYITYSNDKHLITAVNDGKSVSRYIKLIDVKSVYIKEDIKKYTFNIFTRKPKRDLIRMSTKRDDLSYVFIDHKIEIINLDELIDMFNISFSYYE